MIWAARSPSSALNARKRSGIESDDVANYVFPKTWPKDRDQRARIIGGENAEAIVQSSLPLPAALSLVGVKC